MFEFVNKYKRECDVLKNKIKSLEHELEKLCTKEINEDYKLGDKIWFFYHGKHGRNYHGYYDGVIEEISERSNGYTEYTINTTGCKQKFTSYFRTDKKNISHTLKLLREKIIQSNYIFVIDESVCEPEIDKGDKNANT